MNPGSAERTAGTQNRAQALTLATLALVLGTFAPTLRATVERPNILLCIADDWSWPHAGAYGDPTVQTPVFDRLAREGALCQQAFVSAPSCTSSRAAILTGQSHWRLRESANLWSTLRKEYPVYPERLEAVGYHIGFTRKGWGPGRVEVGGRTRPPNGKRYQNFQAFLAARQAGQPFCFWFGSNDPHRPYETGAGAQAGVPLDTIHVPACLPDAPEVRADIADYYSEVQRFDREVGQMLELLESRGELDHTLVVMTSDNGMPFPRAKANLYDLGTRVPLALRWPDRIPAGSQLEDLVSLTDLAPSFLEAAGLQPLPNMTGKSLLPLLTASPPHNRPPHRPFVLTGKERHVPCQEAPDPGGYPSRALRTATFLYIRNYSPDRWPAGTPNYTNAFIRMAWLADTDNGPTKFFLANRRAQTAELRRLYELSFGRRPAEELYDLKTDSDQLVNVASQPAYAAELERLRSQLTAALIASGDPREVGGAEVLESYPYYGGAPAYPGN